MRLRSLDPPLDEDLILALEACNIKTDTDLVFSGHPTDIWLKLPQDTVSLKELNDIAERITTTLTAPAYTGLDLLKVSTEERETMAALELTSGVNTLDNIVGGFGYKHIIEITGDRGSGKTTLALQVVLRQLAYYPQSSAVWIDTTGDTSADRILSILAAFSGQAGANTALQRLQITRAFDVDALEEAIEELQASFLTRLNIGQPILRTLTIDSITPLFRPLLSAVTSQGHATMVSLMRRLRIYAEAAALTVLVLNGTSASQPNRGMSMPRKPALGPSFTYASDATLWLAKDTTDLGHPDADEVYIAEMLRSKYQPLRPPCTFKMMNGLFTDR